MTVIRDALIVDGSGREPEPGAIRVAAGGVIAERAPDLAPDGDEATVDAGGRVLAPGFIDLHSHSDLYSLVLDGEAAPVGDVPKLLQGCTAQVMGQDGVSAAPVGDDDIGLYPAEIAGLEGTIDPGQWT